MSKYLDAKWLTFIVTIIITAVNKYFGFQVDIGKVVAALIVITNFLIAQFSEDVARIKAGQQPRSSLFGIKTLTMVIVCLFLGVANYYDWPMNEQEKSIKDTQAAKKEARVDGSKEFYYTAEGNE
jgi:Na+/melibiose symporter-like transporter